MGVTEMMRYQVNRIKRNKAHPTSVLNYAEQDQITDK